MLLDAKDLVKSIKKAAVEAVDASKPTEIRYGTVISVSPLKIKVEQKMTLTDVFLVLTRNVKDYTVNISMDWTSENAVHDHSYTDDGSSLTTESNTHNHQIKGTKAITIHNALKIGEKVLLAREQGGQKYIVIDRI